MAAFQHYWSSRRARATLLAGTALTGRVLRALVPPTLPTLAASAVVLAVVPPIFGVGGMSARADDVGGSGGLGPSRNNGFALGGPGGTATHPNGYTGTSGDRSNRSGGGGGGGAIGGLGGNGGASYNGAAGGLGGATAGANGRNGVQGSEAGGGGGGGAGGANPTAVGALNNSGALTGQAGGYGGVGAFGTGFLNSAGGGGGGGAGAYGAIVTGGGMGLNGMAGVITGGAGGAGGNGGSGGSTNNGGQAGNGGGGGIGVQFTSTASGATFSNMGQIIGGAGGGAGNGGYRFGPGSGGNGGVGLQLNAGGIGIVNSGTISGGIGGSGAPGGNGGIGVQAASGGTISNAGGTISGGAGGAARGGGPVGVGGTAIVGLNLTIGNAGGTIAGGMSGDGTTQAYAIEFDGGTNYVGTGGKVSGGIDVVGGSFQPALPGSAVGTPLTIASGPLMFAAGTSFNIRITSTATDSVNVAAGGATLNGATVTVAAGNGVYAARTYTILTAAGGVAGTFSGVTTNLAFLTPTLSYDADDVYLTISGGSSYLLPGLTRNQYAAAFALTNAARANGNTTILTAVNQLTVPEAQAVFSAITGEGIAAAQNSAFGSTALFVSSIFDQTTFYGGDGGSANQITLTAPQPGFSAYAPAGDASLIRTPIQSDHIRELADLPSTVAPIPAPIFVPQRTWRAWATGFGGVEDFSGNGVVGSAGQSDTIYGGTLGIDYQVMPNYLAGLAIGGSNGAFSVPGRATSGSTTGGHVAFYDLATFGAFYATSTTSASFYSNQTTRTIAGFGGETDRGNFRSNAYSSKVEFGRHFAAYGGVITPFASIELTELRSYGFTETPLAGPGLFALNVQGQDTASVPSLVGARFQTVLPLGNGLVLSPSLQLAWEHQFSPQRPVLAGLINLPGAVFLTNGASPARDSAAVKAGGELAITRQAALFANFDGDFSGVDRFYGGKGGFKYVW